VSFESFSEEIIIDEKTGEKGRVIMTPQLKEAFQAIDAESDIHDIQLLIDDIDMNGDGKVDENEWRMIMLRKFLGEDDDSSIMHIFSMLDDNKDGYIPLVELRGCARRKAVRRGGILMREGQAPLSEQEVDELLMFADIESDGLINYRTFLRWLSAPQEAVMRKDKEEDTSSAKALEPAAKAEPAPPLPGAAEASAAAPAAAGAAPTPMPSPTASSTAGRRPQPQASPTGSQPQASPTASEAGDGRRGRRGRRPAGATPTSAAPG